MTPDDYLAQLPDERRTALAEVRNAVNAHLTEGFEEVVQYGMISWVVPLERFATTYNKQPLALASLGNQKHHMALYLMCVYGDEGTADRFHERWRATGKTLDMGKSCVRFKRVDDLALDVIREVIAEATVDDLIGAHERAHAGRRRR